MSTKEHQIFVSHSRYDKEIRKNFSELFALANIKPSYMEFERSPPNWRKIRDQIKNSEAVFLLLGPNIKRNYYTENWVAFEVGLACAFEKEVWVFEPVNLELDFPVPYVTDYMEYNLDIPEIFDYVKEVMAEYKSVVPFFPLGQERRDRRRIPKGMLVNCPNPECRATFHLHIDLPIIKCPSCRQIMDRSTNPPTIIQKK